MTELAETASSSTTDAPVERLFGAVVDTLEVGVCISAAGSVALAVLPADPVIGSPPCNTRGS